MTRSFPPVSSARRALLAAGGAAFALSIAPRWPRAAEGAFEVVKTDAEWRKQLGEARYRVLRKEDTERAGTSDLLHEKRAGRYHCAGCDLALYESKAKYDSGTGWPSFYAALPEAVGTREDKSWLMTRTEIHCRRCGGHLGHVFDDGPPPTGMRHCVNGLSLTFHEV